MTDETYERHDERKRPSWVVPVAVIVGVLALAALAYWFLTQGPGQRIISPPGSTVLEFSGTGDQITNAFQVREQWDIHWENSGDRFAFAITGDRDLGTIIEQEEPGSGVTSVVASGTFRIEVDAEGHWSIRIAQGE